MLSESGASQAVTNGIEIAVKSQFVAEKSSPTARRYAFAYTVTITNRGKETAQLQRRHWMITDSEGDMQEVRGDGVVGEQPILAPGEAFEYTSFCVIPTPSGVMRGTYQMVTKAGQSFNAQIAPFHLAMPYAIN